MLYPSCSSSCSIIHQGEDVIGMLFEVKEGIWFDNLSATIHRGTPGGRRRKEPGWEPEPRRGQNWRPTLVYLSASESPSSCRSCHADCGSHPFIQTAKPFFTFADYVESYERLSRVFGGFDTLSFFGDPLAHFDDLRRFIVHLDTHVPREQWPDLAIHVDPASVTRQQMDVLEHYGFRIAAEIGSLKQTTQEGGRTLTDAMDRNAYNRVLRGIDRFTDRDIHVFAQYTFDRSQLDRYEPGLAAEWYSRLESLQMDNYDVIPLGSSISRARFGVDEQDQWEEARARYLTFCEESADYYLHKLLEDDIAKLPRMFVGLLLRIMTQTLYPDCSAGYSLSLTPDRKIFPCAAFAADDRFAVPLDELNSPEDLTANPWFRGIQEAERLRSSKCEKCMALRACSVWCKAQALDESSPFDQSMDERCMLMSVYTRRIVQFLVEQYPKQREFIRTKLLAYDRDRLRQKSAYETV
ncbi:hypothetical protein B9G55_18085 [Saccharibacillus sp. O16]|nr:hypothetical protein B9G55_18085 [Saccharibacillus sp. O16]